MPGSAEVTNNDANSVTDNTGAEPTSSVRHLEQLILVRYLLRQANDTYDDRDPRACGLALSLAQDAVEHLLWAAVELLGAQVAKQAPFDRLFDAVNAALAKQGTANLPDRQGILRLNNARVSFKHHANLPDAKDARKHISRAEDFCHSATEQVFRLRLQTISEAELVEDEAVRQHLVDAERYLGEGLYRDCVVEAATAARKALQLLARHMPERHGLDMGRRVPRFRDRPDVEEWVGQYVESVSGQLSDLRGLALMSQLGLKQGDYLAFRSLTPNVDFSISGKRFVTWIGLSDLSDDEESAGFCLRFATDVALAVQRAMGDLLRLQATRAKKVADMRAAAAGESGTTGKAAGS